jgi:hypothetical protein
MDTKADVEKSISSARQSPVDSRDAVLAHVVLIPQPSTHPRDPLVYHQT